MPSQRRLKATLLLAAATLLILFYITHGASSTRSSDFYKRTKAAMNVRHKNEKVGIANQLHGLNMQEKEDIVEGAKVAKARVDAAAADDDEETGSGVKVPGIGTDKGKQRPLSEDVAEGARKAKGAVKEAGSEIKDAIHGISTGEEADEPDKEKSVAGRKKMKDSSGKVVTAAGGANGEYDMADGVAKVGNTGHDVQEAQQAAQLQAALKAKDKDSDEDDEQSAAVKDTDVGKKKDAAEQDTEADKIDHRTEVELDSILKKSPIIIFSKSYCPYSLKAKTILLELYKIVPAPYVEELDKHELGPELQQALRKSTGRGTVPNVLVNGKSIGGGDDIAALHDQGKLADKLRELGGKRLMEVSERDK